MYSQYYSYNHDYSYPTWQYSGYQQQMLERQPLPTPNRDINFEVRSASVDKHGDNFVLYSWDYRINPQEYLLCRLYAEGSQNVISAAYSISGAYPVYTYEDHIRSSNVWVKGLHNNSNYYVNLTLQLIATK
ncbi:hypothetical protein [Paenibacillus sp. S-12]|uniref:hypothetical protein n=1 Tax=Paenibacillus sp. S-12 TaxID=3031371 RepID=UPI0025A1FE8C|nr:hypothetical protein [Paenibacillus sp. S-12]